MNILIVLTSHDRLGDSGQQTGFWLEELAAPYYVFADAGVRVVLASPLGGPPPLDPKSDTSDFHTEATRRFQSDAAALSALAGSRKLSEVDPAGFDAVFYPGGHGPLWDLAESRPSISLVETMLVAGKPIGAVCHGVAALLRVRSPGGAALISKRQVTGFSNSEEAAIGLTQVVRYSVEDELKRLGGRYSKGEDWAPWVVADGGLVTGQNPASSAVAAAGVLRLLPGYF